jgi:hypothetical protein
MRGQPCKPAIALSCIEGQFYLPEDNTYEYNFHGIAELDVHLGISH